MLKLLTVIGARPQIIKSAALNRTISANYNHVIEEVLVHTGQHYDKNMSEVFFEELNIPIPAYNLGIGSGSHGEQTANMIKGLEKVILKENPNFLVLYGDTNSTIAGALAASKLGIPIIHIEAGLRSFNKKMPEEINRILCDHISSFLFAPTQKGFNNLIAEGFNPSSEPPYSIDNPGVFHCGDIMYDNSLFYGDVARDRSQILSNLEVSSNNYNLITIHRDFNTDNSIRLKNIFSALLNISESYSETFVFPIHPRTLQQTRTMLDKKLLNQIQHSKKFIIIPPISFLDMIQLEKNAKMIFTDSGGVQKEAYFYKKPVIILRPETEWVEIVENGNGILADADESKILEGYNYYSNELAAPDYKYIFGDGKAAEFISETMIKYQ